MKDVFVNIRMTPELKDRLTALAEAEHRSLSGQIVWMLTQGKPGRAVPQRPSAMENPDGVSEQTWADFKKLRLAKRAPITARAIEGIAAEAMKAGMTLEAALRECCARGWTGFKADWVRNKQDEIAALLRPSTQYLEM